MENRLQKWRLTGMLSIVAIVLAGCGEPFLSALQPAGEVAKMQYDLIILSTAIMVGVVLVVTVIFLYVIFRFKRKAGDKKIPKQIEGSHTLELIWTIIPILLLIVLAVPTVSYTFQLADTKGIDQKVAEGEVRDAVVVNVRANQFWWEFEYPDYGVVTSQDLIVPTDERVYFNLTASDVKHSFWVPAAGGKIDTNPDNVNQFFLTFDSDKSEEAGNLFYGKCAELCGEGHALMDFKVKTVSKDEFVAWIDDMKQAVEPPQVQGASAQQGEAIFMDSCISCHAVTTNSDTPTALRIAPNLANFGDREMVAGFKENNEENVKEWIKNPQEIKPGNSMPGYAHFSDEELNALTDYLMQLKVQE